MHRSSAKTHCPRGHAYDLANTYVCPNGWRKCRACCRRNGRNEDLTKYKQRDAQYYADNKDQEKLRNSKYHKDHFDQIKARNLKHKYGITLEKYNALFKSQDGLCAICHKPEPSGKLLAVDHDHETKQVRGLLCHLCNRSLGGFQDDVELLESAVIYLKKFRQ